MKISAALLAVVFATSMHAAESRPVVSLWPTGAPGSEARKDEPEKVAVNGAVSNVHNPTLTVYLPPKDKATGAAVIIAPGGAHRFHTIASEGYNVGQWLADHGIAGFVLKYRLARDDSNPPGTPQPYTIEGDALADAQRAIRLIRSRASEWGVNPAAVGILGFSAGGEIAALAAMRFDTGNTTAPDPIDRLNARPDFQALLYPGQSGKIIPEKGAPPAFLACGADDRPDISEGLPAVYLLFKKAGVPVELHIYTGVGHGFGYRPERPTAAGGWPERFRDWLVNRKFVVLPIP
jgi:acetyl esterase/lipase